MNDLVAQFLNCLSELTKAYRAGDWPGVLEHAGHLVSQSASLWRLLTTGDTPSYAAPDGQQPAIAAAIEELEYIRGDLGAQYTASPTMPPILPRVLLTVIELALQILVALRGQ